MLRSGHGWWGRTAFAAAVTVAAAAPAGLKQERAALDARILEQLSRESPEAAQAWRESMAASDRGDQAAETRGYERVRRLVPRFSPAVRRLCGLRARAGRKDEAVALCREALALEESADNLAALAMAVIGPPRADGDGKKEIDEALRLVDRAAALDSKNVWIEIVRCQIAITRGDVAALNRSVARLRSLAPDEPNTHYLAAIADASNGYWDEAFASLERAHELGLPDDAYRQLRGQLRSAQPLLLRLLPLGIGLGMAWMGCALLLVVLGFLLSWLALRAAASVPTEASGRGLGMTGFTRRAYRAVLWSSGVYYYLSIPIMIALVLGLGGGTIYGFYLLGQIPIKLVAIVLVVMVTTVGAVLRSLWIRPSNEAPGSRLDLGGHPKLREVLDAVAGRIRTRAVDSVYLTPGTDLAVTERGDTMMRQLRGASSERCLILGAGILDGMRLGDFRSVLAHEYGHFQNQDTAGGGFALAVRRSLFTLAFNLARAGVARWYNPAWWFVSGFLRVFMRISQGASRLQEVLCDRWAAYAYGSDCFERGLKHVIERSALFEAHANAALREVLAVQGRPLANLYAYSLAQPLDQAALAATAAERLDEKASPYASHPPPADRIALVRALAAPGDQARDSAEPAWGLFADREAIERSMTEVIRKRIAEQRGVLVPVESAPSSTVAPA